MLYAFPQLGQKKRLWLPPAPTSMAPQFNTYTRFQCRKISLSHTHTHTDTLWHTEKHGPQGRVSERDGLPRLENAFPLISVVIKPLTWL